MRRHVGPEGHANDHEDYDDQPTVERPSLGHRVDDRWRLTDVSATFALPSPDRGRLRPEQELWLEVLREAGQEVYVWLPQDWTSGAIEDVLRSARAAAA